jgi:hypothetical protein
VNEEQFARLAEGQHPDTGEQLVRHQAPREYVNDAGETVKAMSLRRYDAGVSFLAPRLASKDVKHLRGLRQRFVPEAPICAPDDLATVVHGPAAKLSSQ